MTESRVSITEFRQKVSVVDIKGYIASEDTDKISCSSAETAIYVAN